MDDLSVDLKERSESDEWLQTELDQYDQRMSLHEQYKQQQTRTYEDLKHGIERIREMQQKNHIEAGKYEQQKANHEQQLENRRIIVKETARYHNIRGFEGDLDGSKIQEYFERISKLSKEQIAAVDRARRETEKEVQKVQESVSKLGERVSTFKENKNFLKQQSISNDQKIGLYQTEINSIDIDEGGRATLEASIEDLQSRLEKSKADFKAMAWNDKLRESDSQLRLVDDKIEKLNEELIKGTKQAGDLARLDHLKLELKNSQRSLDTMKGVHNERLEAILGPDWCSSTLEADFQRLTEHKTQQVKTAEARRDEVSRRLDQIEYQLKSRIDDLKKDEDEMETCAQNIRQTTQGDPEDFLEDLKTLQSNRDTLKADVDNYTNLRKYFSDSIKYADKHDKCKLCLRRFNANQERQAFIEETRKKIAKNVMEDLQKQLKDCEIDLAEAKNAGPNYDSWVRISKTELPRLRVEVKNLQEKRETLLLEIEGYDKNVADLYQSKNDAESLSKPVAKILKYKHDIESFKKQCEDLAAKQSNAGLSRTLEEVQEELKIAGEKSRASRENISKVTGDRESARSQINGLELSLSEARNDLITANHGLEKKSAIFKQIEDLRLVNGEHREKLKNLDEQIQDLTPQIIKEESRLDDIKQRGISKERNLQEEANRLSNNIHKLKTANQNVQAYLDEDGPTRLARCQRDIENAEQEIGRIENEQTQVVKEINKISEQLRSQQENKRTIAENIKFRRNQKELKSVMAEIERLSAQNAEADLEHYKKQATYWQHQHRLHSTAETSKIGQLKVKDDQLMQLLDDWNTDYKDAALKYKECHIKVEVNHELCMPFLLHADLVRLPRQRWKTLDDMAVR